MLRISCLILLFAALLSTARTEEPKAAEASTEELIEQLSSDDFATRNKATDALAARAHRIWDRLEQLARSKDLEISQRARMAMSVPGQRELQSEIESARHKRLAIDEEVKTAEAALNRKIRELSEKLQASEEETRQLIVQLDKLPEQEAAEKRKQIAVKKEADAELFKQLTEAQQQTEALRSKYRADYNRLETRLIQLTKLAETGDILKPGTAASWTPAEWPFARRLAGSVSFEFTDTPLPDALKFLSETSKIPIKLDAGAAKAGKEKAMISLRVQDMNAELAIKWISRLAELEPYVDHENSRIILSATAKEP